MTFLGEKLHPCGQKILSLIYRDIFGAKSELFTKISESFPAEKNTPSITVTKNGQIRGGTDCNFLAAAKIKSLRKNTSHI